MISSGRRKVSSLCYVQSNQWSFLQSSGRFPKVCNHYRSYYVYHEFDELLESRAVARRVEPAAAPAKSITVEPVIRRLKQSFLTTSTICCFIFFDFDYRNTVSIHFTNDFIFRSTTINFRWSLRMKEGWIDIFMVQQLINHVQIHWHRNVELNI